MPNSFQIFGKIITPNTVEKAVIALAEEWLPTYINATLAQSGETVGSLAYPQSFQRSFDFDNYDESLTPAFIVVCPGTVGKLERNEAGEVGAWWQLECSMLVADQTEQLTRQVASVYASAIALMLEQFGAIGSLKADQTLSQSIKTRLPVKENRTLALGEVIAETFTNNIMTKRAGPPNGAEPAAWPAEPPHKDPTEPYPEWPKGNTVEFTVEGVPPNGALN